MEILLRIRKQPKDRRDHQEKRLQLLLQEAEEPNARMWEQLAGSQNRQSQQAHANAPTTSRREAKPSTRVPSLNETQMLQRNLEPRKRRREQPMSQGSPYKGGPPHRPVSPNDQSETGSSRTPPYRWASAQRTESPVGNVVRVKVPQERGAYINSYPNASPVYDKEGTSSHATKYRVGHGRQAHIHNAYYSTPKHPRQAPQDAIGRRLDDMLSTPFGQHIIAYEHRVGYMTPKFSLYDGTTDPFDHLMHYRQVMALEVGNEALLCKGVSGQLKGGDTLLVPSTATFLNTYVQEDV